MTISPQVGLSLGGRVFFGSLCAGTFGLGVWQVRRYTEKQEMIKQREADLAMDPVRHLPVAVKSNFRRALLTGKFDHEKEFLVGPRGPPLGALPDGPGSSAGGMSSAPQGYFVLTPLQLDSTSESSNEDQPSNVIVNRGWVPRQLVDNDRRRQPRPRPVRSEASATGEKELLRWDRPSGWVDVVVVPAKVEEPKFLVADHNVREKPAKLYWFDKTAMHAVTGMPIDANVRLVTAVTASDEESTRLGHLKWPVQPSAVSVGNFAVTPEVHAGYAVTWFGLSSAGLYMTRKLITRGRA